MNGILVSCSSLRALIKPFIVLKFIFIILFLLLYI
uniref:Uncharacterized protein n=1 Tax=Siphoviridae sp. ctxMM9 TaxID=2827973 RepID=A0A8S5T5X6_9CAUD|nr:MAG TPA: hypothetical protein [Siphoviridae sp. ctxMM9]